jgi:hypothetical protein
MAQTPQDIRRGLLHAELAGKILANKREAIRLRTTVMQVEAMVKMLQPGFNVASIAARRRNKSNPWFKRGTLFRSAVDVLRRAQAPMDGAGDCGHPDSREGPAGHPVKAINSRVEKRKTIRCPALCMSANGGQQETHAPQQ